MSNSDNGIPQSAQAQAPPEPPSTINPSQSVAVFGCPSVLECSNCKLYAMPPIYQCSKGHIMCYRCRAIITTCPTCLVKMGVLIRNRMIENITEVLPFPCKFKTIGCSKLQPYNELNEHVKYCNFQPVPCPLRRKCKWIGPLSKLVDHLSTGSLIKIFNGDSVKFPAACALDPSRYIEWRMVQCCFGESFMFVLLRDFHDNTTRFYGLVLILGSKELSEKFTYSLELTSDSGNILSWKGTPIPYHDGVGGAARQSKCLVFDVYSAKHFAKGSVLTFDVKIFMKIQ